MSKNQLSSRREMLMTAGVLAVGAASTGILSVKEAVAAEAKAPRWAMVIDIRRCTGCRTCTVACKAEFDTPLGSWNAVVKEVEMGEYPDINKDFIPRLCNHCEGNKKDGEPPCVKYCPEKASGGRAKFITPDGRKIRYRKGSTYRRPDGMIMYDNSLCIGCGKCIKHCPYGARSFNKRLTAGKSPLDNGISKCSFCQHRVDKGVEPSCVNACPNNARIFGDLNDPGSEVSQLAKKFNLIKNRVDTTLLAEEGTLPHVFYIDPNDALGHYKITKENKMAEFRDQIL